MIKYFTHRGLLLICLIKVLFLALPAQAHNPLSGELTFHTDTTNTSPLRYFFKLIYYTDKSLTVFDGLPIARINFSDGTPPLEVLRSNRSLISTNSNTYREVYYFEHQFPRAGSFTVSFREYHRISYLDLTNPQVIAFYIQATVKISTEATENRSPIFLAPIISTGVIGQPSRHNVTAYDADGDSLDYKLVPALQNLNQYIPSYEFPEGATINNRTGEFVWPAPDKVGWHTVVVEISEYRRGQLIGKVRRDFAVDIRPTGLNPVLEIRNPSQVPVNARNQIFITSGTPVKIKVAATNAGGLVAYSELFRHHNVITAESTTGNPREIELTITPNAALKRSLPYIITFRGTSSVVDSSVVYADIAAQQDLTIAIYFRTERVTDQEETTKPGEWPPHDIEQEPGGEDESLTFKVYPNPVDSFFNIQNKTNVSATFLLYNAKNQLVLVQALDLQQTNISRSSNLIAGIYLYKIILEGGKIEQTGKLVLL